MIVINFFGKYLDNMVKQIYAYSSTPETFCQRSGDKEGLLFNASYQMYRCYRQLIRRQTN